MSIEMKEFDTHRIALDMDSLIRLEIKTTDNELHAFYIDIDKFDIFRENLNWFNERFIDPLDKDFPCKNCKYSYEEKE